MRKVTISVIGIIDASIALIISVGVALIMFGLAVLSYENIDRLDWHVVWVTVLSILGVVLCLVVLGLAIIYDPKITIGGKPDVPRAKAKERKV